MEKDKPLEINIPQGVATPSTDTTPVQTNITTGTGPDVKSKGELPPEVQIAISDAIVKVKDSLTANFVTILAIFASFITFLGIEIQILRNICDYWRLIGFSLFILTAVLVFVFAIYIFVDHVNSKGWQKILGMCFFVAVLLCGTFYAFSMAEDEYICKLTQLNDKFEELGTQYSKNNDKALREIRDRVDVIDLKLKSSNALVK
jgi:carbon starvation protein CstA